MLEHIINYAKLNSAVPQPACIFVRSQLKLFYKNGMEYQPKVSLCIITVLSVLSILENQYCFNNKNDWKPFIYSLMICAHEFDFHPLNQYVC